MIGLAERERRREPCAGGQRRAFSCPFALLLALLLVGLPASPALAQDAEPGATASESEEADDAFLDELFEDELDEEEEPEVEADSPEPAPVDEPEAVAEAPADDEDAEPAEAETPVAETPPAPLPEGIEEILVTGDRTMMSAQDAPVAVTSFSADEIAAQNFKDLRDISGYTPNLEIKSAYAASNPQLFIRGVGLNDFNANSAAAVAVYVDEVPINSPTGQLGQFFDLEGIEVLRGPQVVYGRNASAGAIRLNSRKPTGETNADFVVTYGNFEAFEVEGSFETPVYGEDLLSLRVAGRYNERDGNTRNRCAFLPPNPGGRGERGTLDCGGSFREALVPGLDKYVNYDKNWASRAVLRWQPGEADVLLNVHGGQNLGGAQQFQPVGTRPPGGYGSVDRRGYPNSPQFKDGDPFKGDFNRTGRELIDLYGVSVNASTPTGDHVITVVGGYEFNDRLTQEDSDGGSNTTLHTDWGNSAWQAYGEAKIASDYAGSVQWQAAASYLYEDLDVANVFSFQAVIPVIANQSFDQTTSSWAVYGHAVWDVLEDFSIEAGARYSWERKVFAIESQTGMLAGRTLIEDEAKDSWSALTGSLALSWRPIEDVNVYVKYSRGFKPGHFNGGAVLERQAIDPTRPERLDSYEVGLKSFWFDQALTVNASAFYYDYEDYQVFRIESTGDGRIPVQQLINANDARIYGLEFELETRPFQNFESADFFEGVAIQARIGWLESEYLDFTDTFFARRGRPPNVEITEVPVVFTGNRLVSSPRFSASAQIEWDRSLGAGGRYGSIVPSYNFTFRDDTFYDPSEGRGTDPTLNFPKYAVGQEAFFLHNFRIAWRNEDHTIEVAGWVRNAFDKEYKADAFDLSAGFNNVLEVYGDPRTYGVTLSLSY